MLCRNKKSCSEINHITKINYIDHIFVRSHMKTNKYE